jgi:putative transcriptional regulator
MDAMKKKQAVATFRDQMIDSMAELRAIIAAGASPSDDGRLTVHTVEVAEPSNYDANDVRKIRNDLNVSQAVFAQMVGVSDVLVRSWERGVRAPAPIARRLLDQIRAHPGQFARLVRPFPHPAAKVADTRITVSYKRSA